MDSFSGQQRTLRPKRQACQAVRHTAGRAPERPDRASGRSLSCAILHDAERASPCDSRLSFFRPHKITICVYFVCICLVYIPASIYLQTEICNLPHIHQFLGAIFHQFGDFDLFCTNKYTLRDAFLLMHSPENLPKPAFASAWTRHLQTCTSSCTTGSFPFSILSSLRFFMPAGPERNRTETHGQSSALPVLQTGQGTEVRPLEKRDELSLPELAREA